VALGGAAGALLRWVAWEAVPDLTHFGDMEAFWAWAREGPASVFRDLPLHEGAVDTLRRLAHRHRVVIVSSKFDWAIPDTLEWIAEHRLPTREIHFVWDKTSVPCDVYLEDAPENLADLVERIPPAIGAPSEPPGGLQTASMPPSGGVSARDPLFR
jgi:hypothetical protein